MARPEVVVLAAADIGALMRLEKCCFPYHWTEEQFRLGLSRGAFRALGVRFGSDPVSRELSGYLAYTVVAGEMEILNLAVHPDCRRQGLATALMDRLMELCREEDVEAGFLDVCETNRAAIDLYEKFGFNQVGVRKDYYPGEKGDALLYRKPFAPPTQQRS